MDRRKFFGAAVAAITGGAVIGTWPSSSPALEFNQHRFYVSEMPASCHWAEIAEMFRREDIEHDIMRAEEHLPCSQWTPMQFRIDQDLLHKIMDRGDFSWFAWQHDKQFDLVFRGQCEDRFLYNGYASSQGWQDYSGVAANVKLFGNKHRLVQSPQSCTTIYGSGKPTLIRMKYKVE